MRQAGASHPLGIFLWPTWPLQKGDEMAEKGNPVPHFIPIIFLDSVKLSLRRCSDGFGRRCRIVISLVSPPISSSTTALPRFWAFCSARCGCLWAEATCLILAHPLPPKRGRVWVRPWFIGISPTSWHPCSLPFSQRPSRLSHTTLSSTSTDRSGLYQGTRLSSYRVPNLTVLSCWVHP